MNIDINICFAYKNNKTQAEQFRNCRNLIESVIASLFEQGQSGVKIEFANLSGQIKPCTDINASDFIIGDPSHPNFQIEYTSEGNIQRPIPVIILLPNDTWDDKVNSIIKSPLCDVRGIFRASKLYLENRDPDEFGRFYEVIKTLIRQILRRNGLNEENFSKPVDWKVKISDGCEMEFMSLFSTPAMQKMSEKYKDALLSLDDKILRGLRNNLSTFTRLRELKFCIRQAVNNAFSEGCSCLCLRHFYS